MADVMQPAQQMPYANGAPMMEQPEGVEGEPIGYEASEADTGPEFARLLQQLEQWAAADNVAEMLTEDKRKALGEAVKREYLIDNQSRSDWEEATRKAIKRAKQSKEGKSFPWAGASNVNFPIVTTAALQFAARAYPAIIAGASSRCRFRAQTRPARKRRRPTA